MVIPPASARAQSPDSNFFIADDPPCGVCFDPPPRAAPSMRVVRFAPACGTSCKGDSRHEARRLARLSRAPSEGLGGVPRSRAVEESHSWLRFFFLNEPPPPEFYPLPLRGPLPI